MDEQCAHDGDYAPHFSRWVSTVWTKEVDFPHVFHFTQSAYRQHTSIEPTQNDFRESYQYNYSFW